MTIFSKTVEGTNIYVCSLDTEKSAEIWKSVRPVLEREFEELTAISFEKVEESDTYKVVVPEGYSAFLDDEIRIERFAIERKNYSDAIFSQLLNDFITDCVKWYKDKGAVGLCIVELPEYDFRKREDGQVDVVIHMRVIWK